MLTTRASSGRLADAGKETMIPSESGLLLWFTADLVLPPPAEGSAEVRARVAAARAVQSARYGEGGPRTNAEADGEILEKHATPDEPGRRLLAQAAEAMCLSARGYTRILRVARIIADLAGSEGVGRIHIAEALSYQRQAPRN